MHAKRNTPDQRARDAEHLRAVRSRPDVQEKLDAHLRGSTNPFRDPAVQERARAAAAARGYPELTGGNGTGPTVPQALLAERLGWPMEVVVPTSRPSPYPPCYRVDVASPVLRIAIEVDGESHNSRAVRERDARKDALLRSLGWTVLRFTNRRVLRETDAVIAEVLAVASSTSRPAPATT